MKNIAKTGHSRGKTSTVVVGNSGGGPSLSAASSSVRYTQRITPSAQLKVFVFIFALRRRRERVRKALFSARMRHVPRQRKSHVHLNAAGEPKVPLSELTMPIMSADLLWGMRRIASLLCSPNRHKIRKPPPLNCPFAVARHLETMNSPKILLAELDRRLGSHNDAIIRIDVWLSSFLHVQLS